MKKAARGDIRGRLDFRRIVVAYALGFIPGFWGVCWGLPGCGCAGLAAGCAGLAAGLGCSCLPAPTFWEDMTKTPMLGASE